MKLAQIILGRMPSNHQVLSALLILVGSAVSSPSRAVSPLLDTLDAMYSSPRRMDAVRRVRELRSRGADLEGLRWRHAYMILAEANGADSDPRRRALLDSARGVVDTLLLERRGDPGTWFVAALKDAVEASVSDPRRKLELSRSIRSRVGTCLDLEPSHAGCWFLLGRWHEGFGSLSTFERVMVGTVLGGMPRGASLDSARIALERADALRPNDLQILSDLATVLHSLGEIDDAREVARRALRAPAIGTEGRTARKRLRRRFAGL
ncbi:MAG: hypothetical protein H6686_11985 [Fibrobacteria bacterium]|nr:hypothetical protein [Fibrobacteria bacterium]